MVEEARSLIIIILADGSTFTKDEAQGSYYSFFGNILNYVQKGASLFSDLLLGRVKTTQVYIQNPLDKAVNDLEKATQLEDIYIWAAHDVKAYMKLTRDGRNIREESQSSQAQSVKQNFVTDMSHAKEKITSVEIPQIEGQLAFLLMNNLTNINSSLALENILRIKIYQKLLERIETNIKITIGTNQNQMIRPNEIVMLEV